MKRAPSAIGFCERWREIRPSCRSCTALPASEPSTSEFTEWLESARERPDEGIWESRGEPENFTHSRVMTWVALDRAVKTVEQFGFNGPIERWRMLRDHIHRDVCSRGFSPKLGSFVRSYDSEYLDASLLLIPVVGFLPATDPRVSGTIRAVERELLRDGFVQRYITNPGKNIDGVCGSEGAFLACTVPAERACE